jgi:hypothetical protein
MQFDVFSFLAGMLATLVLGFAFRGMFAFHVRQTHIHHHPAPENITAQAMQKHSEAKRLQTIDNPLRRGDTAKKASGHVGKLIDFDTARARLAKKSPPDDAG